MSELSNKVAIVTGGANGLGRRTAEMFVQEGAQVVLADLDEARGNAAATALGAAARFRRADVSKRDEVQGLVDYALAQFGGLHVMLNNAGISDLGYGRFLDQDFAQFERVMNVNVLGVMLGTQIAARYMARHGGGSIINTASIAAVKAGFGFPIYRAAKASVIHFTQSAAIELGGSLIRVNCICPGNIPSDMGTFATPEPGMSQAQAERIRHAVRKVRMSHQPLQRQGQADDIGHAAIFLGSDRALQVTGQIICVDGGASIGDTHSQIAAIMAARQAALDS
jgi:NAD(P)-dependent dehydrogenase (short-subunit alcohol dehydrogenase family)